MYFVVVCPERELPYIVNTQETSVSSRGSSQKTSSCPHCNKQHNFRKMKKYKTTEDKEEAVRVKTVLEADLRGMDKDELEGIAKSYSENYGVDILSDKSEKEQKSSRSRSERDIIQDSIREQDLPSKEEAKEYAVNHGVSGEKFDRVFMQLRSSGKIFKRTTDNSEGFIWS